MARAERHESTPRRARVTYSLISYTTALVLCMAVMLTFGALAAQASELSSSLTPTLSVSGQTVQWKALGSETFYEMAVSNEPRGASGRTTTYFSIARQSGEEQSYAPTLQSGQTAYVGVSADGGLTWCAEEAIVTGAATTPSSTTPVLSVSGQTVSWQALGSEIFYEVAISNEPRGASGRVTQYLTILRQPGEQQSYTLTLQSGQTAYVGVSADGGYHWSAEEATVTATAPTTEPAPSKEPVTAEEPAPVEEPTPVATEPSAPTAPVLTVKGDTIYWTAVPGVTQYTFATILHPATTRETTYTVVTGTSYTPPAVPGQTVNYGLAASVPGVAPWAQEVSIAYPASTSTEPGSTTETKTPETSTTETPSTSETPATVEPSPAPGKIIGTNDGAGWGAGPAKTITEGHITWNRVEIGTQSNTVPGSLEDGFKVLAIAGNIGDGTPLSQVEPAKWATQVVSQLQSNPGVLIAEAGNEMYYKGGIANPVRYGEMYLAAVNAMKAAGVKMRLLFNMWGDYPTGSWSSPSGWSQDANGGGWLRDAVKAVPGLAAAILANGLSTHPYGALGENHADEEGVAAVAAQESVARSVLGSVPPFYITEFGYDMSRCGASDGACSQSEQASKMKAAYEVFLADPHVQGIWWYQSHDDGTGQFGYMNNDNTTRPSFGVLSSIAQAQGQ